MDLCRDRRTKETWRKLDGSSGSTQCEAWRGQHEIDKLVKAGYQIIELVKA